MFNVLKKLRSDEKGTTMAVFAIALPVLIGAVAVSVEAGYWMKTKTDVQMIADMAAYAGAKELESNTNEKARSAAVLQALNNNYDFTSGTIEVNSPPLNGTYAGEEAVEVILVQQGLKFFSGVVSDESIQYRVRAVAAVLKEAEMCALSLNSSESDAFSTNGTTNINFEGCSVGTNSSHTNAMDIGNNTTLAADCLYSAGGINGADSATCRQSNAPQIRDPFADVRAPTASDPEWTGCLPLPSGSGMGMSAGDFTLTPGRYCQNTINIDNTVTLDPGTYIFDGSRVQFGGGTLTGVGVTIVLINGAELDNVNGGDAIILEAQTAGKYAGIAVLSDPITQPAGTVTTFNGGSDIQIGGAIYYPNQEIRMSGNTESDSDCTLVIGDKIRMSGNSTLNSSGCETNFGIVAPNARGTFIVE